MTQKLNHKLGDRLGTSLKQPPQRTEEQTMPSSRDTLLLLLFLTPLMARSAGDVIAPKGLPNPAPTAEEQYEKNLAAAKAAIREAADNISPQLREIQSQSSFIEDTSKRVPGLPLPTQVSEKRIRPKFSVRLGPMGAGLFEMGFLMSTGLGMISTFMGANHLFPGNADAQIGSILVGGTVGMVVPYGCVKIYNSVCENRAWDKDRKILENELYARLKQNGVVLPDKDPGLYLEHLMQGGIAQAYTLSSRKRAWSEIARFEKALAAVEATLREKGRTDHIEKIAALREELRKKPSRFHTKGKLFEITQDIRRRYAELDAQFEIHGTKGLPPLDSVLYPDSQRALSEISLDLAVVQPRNPNNKADVATARELYAQYLSSGLSEVLEPASAEGAKITVSRDPKSGIARLHIERPGSPQSELTLSEKNLEKLPKRILAEMRELAAIRQWSLQSEPGCDPGTLKTQITHTQKLDKNY